MLALHESADSWDISQNECCVGFMSASCSHTIFYHVHHISGATICRCWVFILLCCLYSDSKHIYCYICFTRVPVLNPTPDQCDWSKEMQTSRGLVSPLVPEWLSVDTDLPWEQTQRCEASDYMKLCFLPLHLKKNVTPLLFFSMFSPQKKR